MNREILAQAGKGIHHGTLARSGGQPTNPDRALKLEQLEGAHAEAVRAGSEVEAAAFSLSIDRLLDDARAARTEAPRNEDGTFASSDGGVRGRQPKPNPGGVQEITSMNGLIKAAAGRF
ncbi:MAG: hypothetical protein ABSG95_03190 [Solirubrobacteraceae bacterium]|jgi:hypothetical protein